MKCKIVKASHVIVSTLVFCIHDDTIGLFCPSPSRFKAPAAQCYPDVEDTEKCGAEASGNVNHWKHNLFVRGSGELGLLGRFLKIRAPI